MSTDKTYKALWITDPGNMNSPVVKQRNISDLPDQEVLVRVQYSSLNYKDMLSVSGNPAVTRNFPHQPGIDAAGVVESSSDEQYQPGDEVIVSGYDLGMNTAGGLGQYIRVPANWVVKCPNTLSLRESMIFGTAGFTAALCINKLEKMGAKPSDGKIAVTGATGGVGMIAIALLAKLGYEVAAITGKMDATDKLTALGATEVIHRDELLASKEAPLVKPLFAHAIDVISGDFLVNLLKQVKYYGSVACCGLASSPDVHTTIFPFILRGVNLLGVDCVQLPLATKKETWDSLGNRMKLDNIESFAEEISLHQVLDRLARMKNGKAIGRYLVNLDQD